MTQTMLLLAALCTLQDEPPWRAVFEHLDLTRPALSEVAALVEAGDESTAAEALVQHYLTRREEAMAPLPAVPENYDRGNADKVLAREFTFVGKTHTLPYDIDWNANPPNDHEWPIELNRHYTWLNLARAWDATGDARYARDLAFLVSDWITDNPRPESPRDARWTWRTLECGLRLQRPWPECFLRMLDAPGFTPELLCAMLLSIWEQSDYLMRFGGGGNWLTMEKNGLLTAAVTFPEFADSQAWIDDALSNMTREIGVQVYPDGSQVELTPHYHSVAMRNFDAVYQRAVEHGLKVPGEYAETVERMYEYLALIAKPSGRIPMWNDSDHDDAHRRLEGIADRFGREDIRYIVTRGEEGTAPERASVLLPYAGQVVMRSGWTMDDVYLAMDAGPYGYGHQHEDKLTLDLWGYGEELIVDPGRYTYAPTKWRGYFVSTESHSTVLVDGDGQIRRSDRSTWVVDRPEPLRWYSGESVDLAVGVYDTGYPGGPDVVHIRKLLFVKPLRCFVVVDLLVDARGGDEPRQLTSQLQFAHPGGVVDPATKAVRVQAGFAGAIAAPVAADGWSVSVHEGEEDPPAGWVAWSLHKALKEPASMVRYTSEADLPAAMAMALIPYPGDSPPAVSIGPLPATIGGQAAAPTEVTALRLGVGEESATIMMRHDDLRGPVTVDGRTTSSEVALWMNDQPAVEVPIAAQGEDVEERIQWGYQAGGGYVYEATHDGDIAPPGARRGVPYVYRVLRVGPAGAELLETGELLLEEPELETFEEGVPAEWTGPIDHTQPGHDGSRGALRATSEATTDASYVTVRRPVREVATEALAARLAYRTPMADGGDWFYLKVTFTDSDGLWWSAYIDNAPTGDWTPRTLALKDFRGDTQDTPEHGKPMPDGLELVELQVTLRKGATAEPVAPVLELDDVGVAG